MYISRVDGDVVTYDIRMKKPNQGDYLANGALHTIEHLFATYARNSVYGPGVIYVGPMGCRTGFYLLTRGLLHADAIRLVQDSFRFMADYAGDIPGASEIECGNYREQDLPGSEPGSAGQLPVLKDGRRNVCSTRHKVCFICAAGFFAAAYIKARRLECQPPIRKY